MGFLERLQRGWNAFMSRAPTSSSGQGYYYRPDRVRFSRGNEKSIATAIYNRIAIDAAQINICHCRLDDNDRYMETIDSGLNNCLTVEANVDQTGRAFMQDAVMSMLDEGSVAIVPVWTDRDPRYTDSYKIFAMRTAKIVEWKPYEVVVRVYNEQRGEKQDILLPKSCVAIVENPLFAVVNEYNSTMQRLIRKLALLDVTDEQTASNKLDILIQLPYVIKTETMRERAEKRRKDIESQLTGSKYGIAYIDSTEHVTQLNRSLENNLLSQIEYLTKMVYSQLGITEDILNGSANEQTMLNYQTRTIEPIVSAIVDEMNRKFISKTARSQKQAILSFRDPFKLVPVNNIADIADKFTRNEIMTSNEIRQVIGMKPSSDPKADQLINSNVSMSDEQMAQVYGEGAVEQTEAPEIQNGESDKTSESNVDKLSKMLGM